MRGEPRLTELLADPMTHLLMRRDGVTAAALDAVIRQARTALSLRCRTESDSQGILPARRRRRSKDRGC